MAVQRESLFPSRTTDAYRDKPFPEALKGWQRQRRIFGGNHERQDSILLAYPCDHCGAEPEWWCRTPSNIAAGDLHFSRWKQAWSEGTLPLSRRPQDMEKFIEARAESSATPKSEAPQGGRNESDQDVKYMILCELSHSELDEDVEMILVDQTCVACIAIRQLFNRRDF